MDSGEAEIRRALRKTRDNVKEAAALLGISRQALYLRMRRYSIELQLTPERRRARAVAGGYAKAAARERGAA